MPFLGMHAYQHLDVMLCICEQVTSYMSRRKSRQKSEADKESRLHLRDSFSLEGDATITVDKKLRGVKTKHIKKDRRYSKLHSTEAWVCVMISHIVCALCLSSS